MTEEVHLLYPEHPAALSRVADDPAHKLFKKFGEAMPAGDWNHPGTKQGVYMMGPQGEYLEGGGAISGDARKVGERLRRALVRWRTLRETARYANREVPRVDRVAPPDVEGKTLVLRVHLRDLPRGEGDDSGRRVTPADRRDGYWLRFVEWAWNQNWIGFDDPRAFVPKGAAEHTVDPAVFRQLCRRVLVDNVRGQAPAWRDAEVQSAQLSVKRTGVERGRWMLEYRGSAKMASGPRSFAPELYGRATWDPQKKRFERFDLLAIGMRVGAAKFNQRAKDVAPAPMGIALGLYRRD